MPEINRIVPPGASVTVNAEFDPKAHGPAGLGRADRVVSVVMGSGTPVSLRLTAYVTP